MEALDNYFKSFGLTPTEIVVVKYRLLGITTKKLAEKLFVAETSVKFHATNYYKKLGTKSHLEIFVRLLQRDLINKDLIFEIENGPVKKIEEIKDVITEGLLVHGKMV